MAALAGAPARPLGAAQAAPPYGPPGTASAIDIEASAQPPLIAIGATLTVSGRAHDGSALAGGLAVTLQSASTPDASGRAIAHTVTAADGSFSFAGVAPTRNAWLSVAPAASVVSLGALLPVLVEPRVALASRSLGPGRTRLSIRIAHTPEASDERTAAHWYLAAGGGRFTPAAVTPLGALSAGVAYASAIVDPPARRFQWRVCVNPPWERSMGAPAEHGACPDHPFELARAARAPRARAAFEYGGEARGTPLPPFPSARAIATAERWLDGRAGATALAVVDSAGALSGVRTRAHFETASVVKVMFLAAYLQRLDAAHRALGAGDRALLYPMIHESSNEAASAVLGVVGERAVERVAGEAGMHDYAPGVGWWAYSQTSAADQAQLLWRLGAIVPSRYYGYARELMSTIEPEQSWGIPPVARPRWQVYFKTGALPSRGLFNEVARLERGGVAFSVAVLTDHDPSMAYGEETIAGVARALLGAQ